LIIVPYYLSKHQQQIQQEVMAPPSKLAVATSSVRRLVKEEASYHKEIVQQESRIKKLEDNLENNEDGNAEYQLKQEVYRLVTVPCPNMSHIKV